MSDVDSDASYDSIEQVDSDDAEFNTSARRRFHSKEEQIYGVFGDQYKKPHANKPASVTVTQPLAFVSAGILGGAKTEKKTENAPKTNKKFNQEDPLMVERNVKRVRFQMDVETGYEDSEEDNEEESGSDGSEGSLVDESDDSVDFEEEENEHVGLGVVKDKKKRTKGKDSKDIDSAEADEAANRLHQRRQKRVAELKGTSSITPAKAPASKPVIKPKSESKDKGFGKFASSAVMNMMSKMGLDWNNPRLGKHGQGIVNPITQTSAAVLSEKPKEEKKEESFKESNNLNHDRVLTGESFQPSWRKKSKGPKTKYLSAQEFAVMNEQNKVVTSIIDMTGATAEVVPIESIQTKKQSMFMELRYNLNSMVDATELEITQLGRKTKQFSMAQEAMMRDRAKLANRLEEESVSISRLETLQKLLSENLYPSDRITLESLYNLFFTLKSDFVLEYSSFSLPNVAFSLLLPLFRKFLTDWHPLRNPSLPVSLIENWKSLLSTRISKKLIENEVLPRIRSCIVNESGRSFFEDVELLLAIWKDYLSKNDFDNLLSSFIYPKVKRSIELWDPRTDATPITWVFSWESYFGEEIMSSLYSIIRTTLAKVLEYWKPSDTGAVSVLSPFVGKFSNEKMQSLIMKSIWPKLSRELSSWNINPVNENIAPISWMLAWESLVTPSTLFALLESEFWPKWFVALYWWLLTPSSVAEPVKLQQVANWFSGWKSLFPANLSLHRRISVQFIRGLHLINRFLENQPLEPLLHEILRKIRLASVVSVAPSQIPRAHELHHEELSFKDILERYALSNDMVFMPSKRGFNEEGKQIYLFGSVSVFLDNRCIYAETVEHSQIWKPIALDDLLKRTKNSNTVQNNETNNTKKKNSFVSEELRKFAKFKAR